MAGHMNLNQLRIFHAVARLLSFTRASEELYLTQPGISKHIKELEGYYGTRLFDRLGKKVVLTQAGEILFRITKDIFNLIDESRTRIHDLQGLAGGKLSIGASITIGTYILPKMLVRFRHKYPDVEIAVDISLSEQVMDKVLDNTLEIGLVGHLVNDKRLVAKQFKTDQMVLIVSPRHRWANRRSPVRLQELIDQPFLLLKQGSGTRKIVEGLLEKAGFTLMNIIELGNTEGVKKAVEADLGISIVSKRVVSRELAAALIKPVPLKGLDLRRNFYVVYHKDRYLSEAARAFFKLLEITM